MTTEFKMVPATLVARAIEALTRHLSRHAPMQVPPSENDSDLVREDLREILAAAPASPQAAQPVAWQYRVSAGPQTGWSLWHDGKGEEFKYSYQVETRPLYTHADAGEVERLREVEDAYKALEAVVVLTAKAVGDDTGLMWQKIQFAFLRDIPALRAQLAELHPLLVQWLAMFEGGIASSPLSALRELTRKALSTAAKPEADHE